MLNPVDEANVEPRVMKITREMSFFTLETTSPLFSKHTAHTLTSSVFTFPF